MFPDGKFGKDYKRTKKLTAQEFFQQRILNKDDRFSKNPGFCFAAMSYVEAERLRSNANMTGMKGKRVEGKEGVSYEVKDPCTVFEKVPGTPKYFQKAKYDMISKFENIGPFQVNNIYKYAFSLVPNIDSKMFPVLLHTYQWGYEVECKLHSSAGRAWMQDHLCGR